MFFALAVEHPHGYPRTLDLMFFVLALENPHGSSRTLGLMRPCTVTLIVALGVFFYMEARCLCRLCMLLLEQRVRPTVYLRKHPHGSEIYWTYCVLFH
jgi:hypothetical protein